MIKSLSTVLSALLNVHVKQMLRSKSAFRSDRMTGLVTPEPEGVANLLQPELLSFLS